MIFGVVASFAETSWNWILSQHVSQILWNVEKCTLTKWMAQEMQHHGKFVGRIMSKASGKAEIKWKGIVMHAKCQKMEVFHQWHAHTDLDGLHMRQTGCLAAQQTVFGTEQWNLLLTAIITWKSCGWIPSSWNTFSRLLMIDFGVRMRVSGGVQESSFSLVTQTSLGHHSST